jgi:hypothetical protein
MRIESSNRVTSCGTYATLARSTRTAPGVDCNMPAIRFRSELFPLPNAPRSTQSRRGEDKTLRSAGSAHFHKTKNSLD